MGARVGFGAAREAVVFAAVFVAIVAFA